MRASGLLLPPVAATERLRVFSLGALQLSSSVEEFDGGDALFDRMNDLAHIFDLTLPVDAATHEQTDARLAEAIAAILSEKLGPDTAEPARWYQLLDYYGDGVRLVELDLDAATDEILWQLQNLLVAVHEDFCIALKFSRRFGLSDAEVFGGVVIFHNRILVTKNLLSS